MAPWLKGPALCSGSEIHNSFIWRPRALFFSVTPNLSGGSLRLLAPMLLFISSSRKLALVIGKCARVWLEGEYVVGERFGGSGQGLRLG